MLKPSVETSWGTDPEAFFQRSGAIIGSEKLVARRGIQLVSGSIVRDGVQFELHPTPNTNRAGLARSLAGLMTGLQDLSRANKGVSVNFNGLVEVTRAELDSLTPKSRILGCNPSENIYGEKPITVDVVHYRKRSSGGHIHMGLPNDLKDDAKRLVPLCDIFIGNTAVLFDRDPGAAERRENYGRAGEHRLPKHGLEYRTTSNFWLRDPALMDLTFGLADIAVSLYSQTIRGDKSAWDELAKLVQIENFTQAIDTNDFDLAAKNFKSLFPFLRRHLPKTGFVLASSNLNVVLGLGRQINNRGIEHFFPEKNIFKRWAETPHASFASLLG